LEQNILQFVLQQINKNTDIELSTKLVYLLSAVLRHFPYAQTKFFDYGGLNTLSNLILSPKSSNKIKIKVITLINDLVLEKVQPLQANAGSICWLFIGVGMKRLNKLAVWPSNLHL
jgi:hypothetical protein